MFKSIFRRYSRVPVPAVGVLLFALILVYILGALQAANEREQLNYEQTYHTIPVKVSITNLSATKFDGLEIYGWMADLFRHESIIRPNYADFLKDVQIKCTYQLFELNGKMDPLAMEGITSPEIANPLRPENGCVITWFPGYDESILLTDAAVCLIPESKRTEQDVWLMKFQYVENPGSLEYIIHDYETEVQVVGTYRAMRSDTIYCPYLLMETVCAKLEMNRPITAVYGTLKDNDLLEELKAERYQWFAEPNPAGKKTEWHFADFEYYPFAMHIDDSLLIETANTLENSIRVNKICTVIVFVLSTIAGFLIGFLMIRARKREINLMRTLGNSEKWIFCSLHLEQMLCVLAGTVLGGLAHGFNVPGQILLFVGTYFIGLTISLIIFLRTNLLTTMKEDE